MRVDRSDGHGGYGAPTVPFDPQATPLGEDTLSLTWIPAALYELQWKASMAAVSVFPTMRVLV